MRREWTGSRQALEDLLGHGSAVDVADAHGIEGGGIVAEGPAIDASLRSGRLGPVLGRGGLRGPDGSQQARNQPG